MHLPSIFGHRPTVLLASLLAAVVACGGKTAIIAEGDDTVPDASHGPDANPCNQPGADCADASARCVDIDLSTYDHSCQTDSDCVLVQGGEVCSGQCACGSTPISGVDQNAYNAAVAGIDFGVCPCPDPGIARCLENICTLCGFGPDQPIGCYDAGLPPPRDAGSDASACVDIDLADFDLQCNQDSDCIEITSGVLCDGSCSCGGSSINASGEMEYDDLVSMVDLAACPCPFLGNPVCLAGMCTICGPNGC